MDFDSHSVDLESLDESKGMGRRSFLIGALATGAATSVPLNYAARARARALPLAKEGGFNLGVSSGFPRPRGGILWTRLNGAKNSTRLRLVVAKDRKFANVVAAKDVVAREDRDFTAQGTVRGLDPSEEYFYRFLTKNSSSPVGRFRTAPPLDSNQGLRIVFYSCQNYQTGYYNVQRAIAKEKDVDLVICLGDYVYESNQYEDIKIRDEATGRNKDGVAEFIDEWREKYRLYKSDPDLKAMHAAHPYLAIWDDHEVENNNAGDTESPATTPGETNDGHPRRMPYLERRANGYKAFFNYHPRARFKGDRNRIYEDYRIGKLVHLLLTDERQYRDPQPCGDAIVFPCPESVDPRDMLGDQQKDWWKRTMQASKAKWKVWGNQLMLMNFAIDSGTDAIMDEWDGYQAERTELMTHLTHHGIENVVGITGDIHNFFAGTVSTNGKSTGTPAMTEFVGGSATSPGLPEETGVSASFFQSLGSANPHWKYSNFVDRGYGVLDVKANGVQCTFKRPTTVTQRNGGVVETFAKFSVASGSTTVEQSI
jgi:alkaline phosphatase D